MLISITGLKRIKAWFEIQAEKWLEKRPIELVVRTIKELDTGQAVDMAGSIAYYSFLSLFPLLLGAISILGLFLPSELIQSQLLDFFEQNLPGSADFVRDNIDGIIRVRGQLGIISIVGLVWSGSVIFGAIGRVVNNAWGIKRYRPFYIRKPRDLMLALSTSILFFLSIGFSALSEVNLPFVQAMPGLLNRIFAFLLIFIAFLLIYKFAPNTKTAWKCVLPGAILASVMFEAVRSLFVVYLSYFANYELIYGSIGSIIALLVWIYLSAYIFIIGAEFSSEYQYMLAEQGKKVCIAGDKTH
jgi:membrane protein